MLYSFQHDCFSLVINYSSSRISELETHLYRCDRWLSACGMLGFYGSPASGIKFYTMGNNKSPSIEVPPTHIQSDKPRYVNETCQFFERAIYKFKGNMEETRRVMCVTERQIDDKLFRLYKILRVTPKSELYLYFSSLLTLSHSVPPSLLFAPFSVL